MEESFELRNIDEIMKIHLQSFLNNKAKAKKKTGKDKMKFVYSDFRKFFDYEKEIDKIRNKNRRSDLLSKVIEYKKGAR